MDLLRCCTDGVCLRSYVSRHSPIAISITMERKIFGATLADMGKFDDLAAQI